MKKDMNSKIKEKISEIQNDNKLIHEENYTHKKAFVRYCQLRSSDNDDVFNTLAEEFDRQISTVYSWSTRYQWKSRYNEMMKGIINETLEEHNQSVKWGYIRIFEAFSDYSIDLLTNGGISVKGEMSELDKAKQLNIMLEAMQKVNSLITIEDVDENKNNEEESMNITDIVKDFEDKISNKPVSIEEIIKDLEEEEDEDNE